MKKPGARGLTPGKLSGPGGTPALCRIVRAVANSSLCQIDHFQNRPQKNSEPTEATPHFTTRSGRLSYKISRWLFFSAPGLGHDPRLGPPRDGRIGTASLGRAAYVKRSGRSSGRLLPLPASRADLGRHHLACAGRYLARVVTTSSITNEAVAQCVADRPVQRLTTSYGPQDGRCSQ